MRLSVILSAQGPSPQLGSLLKDLAHQLHSISDVELILVLANYNGPIQFPDPSTHPIHFQCLQQEGTGQSAAWNQGARIAQGDIFLFLSEQIIPNPGLVAAHLGCHGDHGDRLVIGSIGLNLTPKTHPFARFIAELNRKEEQSTETQWPLIHLFRDEGNISVPRSRFWLVNGFAKDLIEGIQADLAVRLEDTGIHLVFLPAAEAVRQEPGDLQQSISDLELMGKVNLRLFLRYPRILSSTPLGSFNQGGLRGLLLRRMLLKFPIFSPLFLGLLSGIFTPSNAAREWFRFVYAFAFWAGVKRSAPSQDLWRRLIDSPIILMYHGVASLEEPVSRYLISKRQFSHQMNWFKKQHRPVLTLNELVQYHLENRLPPAGSVVITFDDGYQDNLVNAYPILKQLDFQATIFLVTKYAGSNRGWDNEDALRNRKLLSWRDMLTMQPLIHIGAHSHSHPHLTSLSSDEVEIELKSSREVLAAHLGYPVQCFAYPNGSYSVSIQETLKRHGFLAACCSEPGAVDPVVNLYALKRIEIRGTESMLDFILAIYLKKNRVLKRLRDSL